jgi:hypothetical protein
MLKQVDLAVPPYNYGGRYKDHIWQFLSDSALQWPFWDAVLESMELK